MNASRYTWANGHYREVIDGVVRVDLPGTTGVARWWHANGVLAKVSFLTNGIPDGITREWHENGKLARVIPYEHGFVHGVVEQWGEDGKLLGTYEMNRGKGTVMEWNEDGTLKVVKEILDAGCERDRVWDEHGHCHEVYVWKDHVVSRTEFFRRAPAEAKAA